MRTFYLPGTFERLTKNFLNIPSTLFENLQIFKVNNNHHIYSSFYTTVCLQVDSFKL